MSIPASPHSAAEAFRAMARKIEEFYKAEILPTIESNAEFILFGESRSDPYARVIDQVSGLVPGFVTALRMRGEALSPAEVIIPATPPLVSGGT